MATHTAASSVTLAPVTPRTAELLHLLFEEACKVAAPAVAVPAGAIVLNARPNAIAWHYTEQSTHRVLEAKGAHFGWRVQCAYAPQTGVRAARWHGRETRYDTTGEEWQGELKAFIQDDFGDLVEVKW